MVHGEQGDTHQSTLLVQAMEEPRLHQKPRLKTRSSASRNAMVGRVEDRHEGGEGQIRRERVPTLGDQLVMSIVILCLMYLFLWEITSCISEVSYNMSGRWRVAIIERGQK